MTHYEHRSVTCGSYLERIDMQHQNQGQNKLIKGSITGQLYLAECAKNYKWTNYICVENMVDETLLINNSVKKILCCDEACCKNDWVLLLV